MGITPVRPPTPGSDVPSFAHLVPFGAERSGVGTHNQKQKIWFVSSLPVPSFLLSSGVSVVERDTTRVRVPTETPVSY